MRLRPSNRRQRKRASHFSCLCKKSNPKNTPPRDRPSGKPWPDLLQPGRLPQASPWRSQGGPSLRPHSSNNSAPAEGFPVPPWRRHGRGCGDRVKGPWRALSVPPQQDVVSGRPGRSGPGHGLPGGRLRGGALSLVPFFGQAKKGTRPRAMRAVRSAPLEVGETACRPVRLLLAAS